jgi:hypothetical protein
MTTFDKTAYIERLNQALPEELRALPVWLCWRSLPSKEPGKKPRKVPYYVNGNVRGAGLQLDSPEDRTNLGTFEEAVAEYQRGRYAGLGVALGAVGETWLSGIDLDDIAPTEQRAAAVVATANSYAETSPSGTGLKIFGWGALKNLKEDKSHLEIYGSERFFTVTGLALNGAHLADLTAAAETARRLFLPAPAPAPAPSATPTGKFVDQGRHNYLVKVAARLRAKGLEGDELLAVMRVHNEKHCSPPKPDQELVEIVEWAAKQSTSETASHAQLLGPQTSIGTYDEWHGFPFEPPDIVTNFLPEDAGGSVGPGGHGKTTLALYESVLIALGRPVYGREVVRSGPTLIITAEDRREIAFSRLNQICRALPLSKEETEHVRERLFVEDVTGTLARIAQADRFGRVQPGALLGEIIEKYRESKLAAVIVDPTSLLGPGEMFGNDGAAELLRICRYLSRELRASVRLIHHVGQNVSRDGIMDQYAARGGTAFVDNSRFQHQLVIPDERKFTIPKWGTFRIPETASDLAIAKGRVLAILIHKLSYAERDKVPIFLLRDGFQFTHMPALEGDMTQAELDKQTAADVETLREFLCAKLAKNMRLSPEQCAAEYRDELKMTRDRCRKAINAALANKVVVLTELPAEERKTRRTHYLHPAVEQEM